MSSTGKDPATPDPFSPAAVRAAYDAVAHDYETAFGGDLAALPLDRAMLERAARRVPPGGGALDLGCGTGIATAELAAAGARTVGADLSMGMLAIARRLRRLPVAQADARRLPFREASLSVVVAWYSLQHVPRHELSEVLRETRRVLVTGGSLVVAAHLGKGDVVSEELLGHRFDPVAGCLYSVEELGAVLADAGFEIEGSEQRGPLEHEHPTQRLYVVARRTG